MPATWTNPACSAPASMAPRPPPRPTNPATALRGARAGEDTTAIRLTQINPRPAILALRIRLPGILRRRERMTPLAPPPGRRRFSQIALCATPLPSPSRKHVQLHARRAVLPTAGSEKKAAPDASPRGRMEWGSTPDTAKWVARAGVEPATGYEPDLRKQKQLPFDLRAAAPQSRHLGPNHPTLGQTPHITATKKETAPRS
jgi:hypothetical protein